METHVQRDGARMGERPPAPLRLYLLGRFEAIRTGAPVPAQAWRRRRPADLLKLVALAPGRSVSREQALDALWPGKDAASGANNLHRALFDLRRILGARFVDIERGALTLRGDVWVDVDAFERAVRGGGRAGWTQAVALYRGDLAPEDCDAPWLRERREALRAHFVEAALPLARAAAAEGDDQLALPLLRRIVEAGPGAEEARRLLAHLEGGGAAPCIDSALAGARRAACRLLGTADPAPVRGRGELLLLLEALAEQGSGAIVLLGERGVGKTRLAVEGARLAEARGAAILCGAGGALVDALEEALCAVADGRPLFLLLDDLHAADRPALDLLHRLAARAPELRLVVVATVAEEAIHAGTPIQAALARLDSARLAHGIRVPRLSLAGTREQVADLCGRAPDERTLAGIYRATDGTPLLVERLVRAQTRGDG